MLEEMGALKNNETWEIVDFPKGKKLVSSNWIFIIKHKATKSLERYKVRFKGKVFRLKKSFYDLKQSHRAWFDRFTKAMVKFGYKQSQGKLSHIPSYFLSLFKIPSSIASKIEKLQRDFLWSGAGEGKKDHLIRWDVVSRPKELGGLGFGKTSLRNIALLGKWLWRFPRERSGLWHKVIASIMGHILMDGTPTWWLDGHTDVLGRFKRVVFVIIMPVFNEIFFLGLVKSLKSYLVPFGQVLVEFKSPSKVKALAWLVAHGRSIEDMLVIAFKGLGNSLRGKTLRQIACLTLLWMVWQERSNRIFEDKGRTEEMLWDLILFFSSLWASCIAAFRGVPLSVLQLNWTVPDTIRNLLVNQMLLCFGIMFASQDNGGMMSLLGMLEQCLKTGKKQLWHAASVTNMCVGLLAGLKALLALRSHGLGLEILNSAQAIFQNILAEGDICASQRRASSEGLGLLARLGNDMFTARMTRSLLGDLTGATDSNYAGSIAVALGCIHRR
ncbi:Protein SWEETIE [Vitis vinifera]|uniref:Protein SWEETIE n=1 Tax=Vitis vinifera TaxID=29760 RepID=A0A438JC43_VITVI|nr:Protein SWEETIE [Vitis vinifera]